MQRTCVKCGHVNPIATGSNSEACPACGVIYAKAVATASRPVLSGTSQSGFGGPPSVQAPATAPGDLDRPMPPRPAAAPPQGKASAWLDRFTDRPGAGQHVSLAAYVERMRAESLYPAFRRVVNATHMVFLAIAAFVAVGAVYSAFQGNVMGASITLGGAAVLALLTRAMRDGTIMLADLCDASVRGAAAQER